MKTKRCSRCKEIKPLEEFYLQASSKDKHHHYCKQCMKAYMRQRRIDDPGMGRRYYAENRERMNRLGLEWRAKHPDYRRQYHLDHREEANAYAREYSKQYRIDHPEKIKKDNQEYYVNHREETAKRTRQYQIDHPEKMAVYAKNRRAKKAGAEGGFTAEQFAELCEQQGSRCLCCGEIKKLTVDHIVPLSKGGSNDISNLQGLCGPCNSKKHTQTIDYRDVK